MSSSITDADLRALASLAGDALRTAGKRVVTAESCTGGWVSKALTDVAGSSQWFEQGFITYSNAAKQRTLGVAATVLEHFGAVSRQTVEQMASGAVRVSGADVALAVSGVAGPEGGTVEKPVGLVWFAVATAQGILRVQQRQFPGDRDAVRRASVALALQLISAAA